MDHPDESVLAGGTTRPTLRDGEAAPRTWFAVAVRRNRTVTGWEWFLEVGGERVTGQAGVGIFTEKGDEDATPAKMLPRLLAKAAAREDA